MIIKQQFVKSRTATYPGVNRRRFITIHETGNAKKDAGAQAHANLQSSGFSSSWHWQVDDEVAIQSFPHAVQCWHAGDGRGNGNLHSIAIEICVNENSHFKKAVSNAAELTRKIMKEENISLHAVVQHHHWSRKNCPYFLRSGRDGIDWQAFKNLLQRNGYFTPIVYGATGESVKQLQRDLNKLRYNLDVDGSFGPKTRWAVKQFQSRMKLAVDGFVGPKTWEVLKREVG